MNQHLLIGGALALALAAAAPAVAKPAHAGGPHGKHGQVHQNHGGQYGYGKGGCPPGLAKKNNGCLPPGQAKKLRIGDRYARTYGYNPYAYNRIPYDVRRQYGLDPSNNYYYDNGTLYGVDPRTLVVEQIINAVLR